MKIKLSLKQSEVAKRLQAGEIIHKLTGMYARCFFSKDSKLIKNATWLKLEKLGLIERDEDKGQIILTEKGKNYK